MDSTYQAGYTQGKISRDELAEMGHTPQSYADHLALDYSREINSTHLTAEEKEFYYGLIDAARDNCN